MGWGYKVIFRKKKKKEWKRSFALDRFSKTPAYIPHAQFLLTVSVRSATAHHLLFKGSSWSSHRIKACGSSCYLISRKTTNQPTNSNSAANMNAKVSNSSLMDDRYDLLDLDDQSLPGISTDSVSEDRKYIVFSKQKKENIYHCYFSNTSRCTKIGDRFFQFEIEYKFREKFSRSKRKFYAGRRKRISP